jgi:hypothetical protein
MQFFKAISLLSVFFMAMFGFVAATPMTDLKRDVIEARTVDVGAQVIAVLKALQSNITVPLSQIGMLHTLPLFISSSRCNVQTSTLSSTPA